MEVVNLFDKKDDFMDQNKLIAVFWMYILIF